MRGAAIGVLGVMGAIGAMGTIGAIGAAGGRKIASPPLRLVSARAIGTGFVELVYEVPHAEERAS